MSVFRLSEHYCMKFHGKGVTTIYTRGVVAIK